MYGTIVRMRLKPGAHERITEMAREYATLNIPGYRGEYVYRLDGHSNEYVMAVVFDSKADYQANAESPAQHQRFLAMRALLESDPEWSDGEIVQHSMRP